MPKNIKISLEHRSRTFSVPVKTSRGIFETRETIIVTLKDEYENTGQGEIAPWPGFGCESLEGAEKLLETVGVPALFSDFSKSLHANFPCTRHALEAAKFFLKEPNAGTAPEPEFSAEILLRTNSILSTEKILKTLENNSSPKTFKIKIGLKNLKDEIRFCREILKASDACGNVKIRFDANGAWNGKDSLNALAELSAFPSLDFIEQPLEASPENDVLVFSLPRELSKKFALDESLREPWTIPEDVGITAVVKPLLIGDFQRLRNWLSAPTGTRYVISTVFESEVGRKILRFLSFENKKNPRQLISGLVKI